MRTDRRSVVLVVFVTAWMLIFDRPALADERTEARRHFRRGMELLVQGQVDSGVEELELAYQILPHPNVLYNIGRAYAEAGRYEEALDYFARYLESSPADADDVRGYVAALETRIANRAMLDSAAATETAATSADSTQQHSAPAVLGTGEEIADLRATADRLESLARVIGGTELGTRAAALRAMADRMERANTASVTATVATDASPTNASTPTTAVEGTTMSLSSGDTELYEERFVSSTRAAVDPLDAPNSTTIITRQDIRLTGITSLGELVRRVAGVQVMTTGPGETNIAIRGFDQRLAPRVLLLVNGRAAYADPLGIALWQQQQFSVEDIERIEVVRGPASALYGANGFSGIINVITRTPGDEPGVEVDARVGTGGQVRAYVGATGRGGRDGRAAYRISAAYDQVDRFMAAFDRRRIDAIEPSLASDPNVAMRNIRVFGNVTYRLGQNARAFAEGGTTYFNPLSVAGAGVFTDLYMRGTHSAAVAGIGTGWGGVRFFWNNVTSDVEQWAQRPIAPNNLNWSTYDVEATFAHEFDTGPIHHNVVAGVGYRRKYVSWEILDATHDENHFQGFAQDSIRIGERLTLVAGARVDVHPLLDRPVFSPRGALVGRVGERQAIRASVTTAFRTPSFLESYVSLVNPTPLTAVSAFAGGSEVYHDLLGRQRLGPERILANEIGYQNNESDYFTVDAAMYLNRVEDLINQSPDTELTTLADNLDPRFAQINADAPSSSPFVVGRVGFENSPSVYYLAGMEIAGRVYPLDGLDVWANYTFNLTYIDQGDGLSLHQRAPRNQLNFGVQYRRNLTDHLGLDVAIDAHVQSKTVWDEQQIVGNAIATIPVELDPLYMINGRVGVRLLDDRLSLGVVGYNVNAFWGTNYRQHPFTQPVPGRILASASYRF